MVFIPYRYLSYGVDGEGMEPGRSKRTDIIYLELARQFEDGKPFLHRRWLFR